MKTRLTFLQTIPFALALAGWMPLSAPAQNAGELKPPAQTNQEEQVFYFPGGYPRQFMEAMQRHFKVDWLSIATIPREMEQVMIPRLRFTPGPTKLGGPGASGLVYLYNSLAQRDSQLGTLVVEGDVRKPDAVMLVPNKSAEGSQAQSKVRAFPLMGIPEADWTKLMEEIVQTDGGAGLMAGWADSIHGEVRVHRDTALLVAKGTEYFVELADSVVTAFRANLAAKEAKPQTEAVKSPTEKK